MEAAQELMTPYIKNTGRIPERKQHRHSVIVSLISGLKAGHLAVKEGICGPFRSDDTIWRRVRSQGAKAGCGRTDLDGRTLFQRSHEARAFAYAGLLRGPLERGLYGT